MEPTLRIISLGAGVQSSTLLILALEGLIGPKPDCAIFSDTGWEPRAVYEYLEWLKQMAGTTIPILTVSAGNIRDDVLAHTRGERRVANPPFFMKTAGGEREGVLRRGCTTEYKVQPITQKTRELLGVKRGRPVPKGVMVERWFGISMDEVHRMRDAPNKWEVNRYPLIELEWTRHKCLEWMASRGYPMPPKSACIGCPYRSDRMWREMRDRQPVEWMEAVEWDRAIRTGMQGVRGEAFLHRSLVPLDEVDLRTMREKGQVTLWDDEEDGFGGECGGLCGT